MNSSPDKKGLILVFTGPGKGKTTAALGILFRALGRGMKCGVVQFLKGKWETGERKFAKTIADLDFHVMGLGFTWESDDLDRDKNTHIRRNHLRFSLRLADSGRSLGGSIPKTGRSTHYTYWKELPESPN